MQVHEIMTPSVHISGAHDECAQDALKDISAPADRERH